MMKLTYFSCNYPGCDIMVNSFNRDGYCQHHKPKKPKPPKKPRERGRTWKTPVERDRERIAQRPNNESEN